MYPRSGSAAQNASISLAIQTGDPASSRARGNRPCRIHNQIVGKVFPTLSQTSALEIRRIGLALSTVCVAGGLLAVVIFVVSRLGAPSAKHFESAECANKKAARRRLKRLGDPSFAISGNDPGGFYRS